MENIPTPPPKKRKRSELSADELLAGIEALSLDSKIKLYGHVGGLIERERQKLQEGLDLINNANIK